MVRYGCTSIWFTAGTVPVSAASRCRCGTWKLDTPIERARPSLANSSSACQVETKSPSYRVGSGQWIRNRSIWSMPSTLRVSSKARRASSGRCAPLFSLLVTKISSRGMPEARMAAPTSRSFRYICAVSMCR